MKRQLKFFGNRIANLRSRRGWTIQDFVAKLELIGCRISPDILNKIETGCWSVSDVQIFLFSEVFRVQIYDLMNQFPKKKKR
jgi:hypothetical protein